jgi:hypothetical protein
MFQLAEVMSQRLGRTVVQCLLPLDLEPKRWQLRTKSQLATERLKDREEEASPRSPSSQIENQINAMLFDFGTKIPCGQPVVTLLVSQCDQVLLQVTHQSLLSSTQFLVCA